LFYFQDIKVTDGDEAASSQLIQVEMSENIIEKSLVKLKETSTVWLALFII